MRLPLTQGNGGGISNLALTVYSITVQPLTSQ